MPRGRRGHSGRDNTTREVTQEGEIGGDTKRPKSSRERHAQREGKGQGKKGKEGKRKSKER